MLFKNHIPKNIKSYRSFFFLVISFCITISITPLEGYGKSYEIPQITVEVEILPNGNVIITEHRTYYFDGSFSWADYRLPLKGFRDIKDLKISEEGRNFANQNTENPGTYMVQQSDNSIRIKWFYGANDEQRTFSISYLLEGALVIGPEWGEFFWNYLSASRKKDTEQLTVRLKLPRYLRSDSLHLWSRGPQANITLSKTGEGFRAQAQHIDNDESVQVRAVFPRAIFDQQKITTTENSFSLEWAKSDEQTYQERLAEQKAEDARYAEIGRILNIVVTLLSILLFIYFYRKFGRKPKVDPPSARQIYEVPKTYHPVVAAWVLNQKTVTSNMLLGNVMELARKGYFIIKEKQQEGSFWSSEKKSYELEKTNQKPDGKLREWDKFLLNHLHRKLENGNNELKDLFTDSVYSEWKEKINEYGKAQNWFDTASYNGAIINGILQVLLMALGVTAAFWSGIIALVSLGTTFCMIFASFAIVSRTEEGEKVYQQLDAYKNQLLGKREVEVEVEMGFNKTILGRHTIFAITQGMSGKKIETLFNRAGVENYAFYWFILHGGFSSTPADVANSLSTLSSTGAAVFPGTTGGAAGGAVAGSAGGGASGGAG